MTGVDGIGGRIGESILFLLEEKVETIGNIRQIFSYLRFEFPLIDFR